MEQRNTVKNSVKYQEDLSNEEIHWGKLSRNIIFGTWSVVRAGIILLCSLMIVSAVCLYAMQYVNDKMLAPAGDGSGLPVQIIVPKGMPISKIALLLEEKNLIRNAKVFKYFVDFSGYGGKIKAGTYIFNGTMTMQQITDSLMRGDLDMQVTTFTIPEGSTVVQIAAILKKQNIISDTKTFLDLCKNGDKFTNYAFVNQVRNSKNANKRFYALEGYLFPAKYEIYVNTKEEEIINKMLSKFSSVMTTEYVQRATALGMTTDQVLALASMIEREGLPADYAKVSSVFQNRLKIKMPLGSDVTVLYALHDNKAAFNTKVDSLYNTYKYAGLPLGPIANPGDAAIKAALYPDEKFIADNYLYFVVGDPAIGLLTFTKTLKQHQAATKIYNDLLKEYNKTHKAN